MKKAKLKNKQLIFPGYSMEHGCRAGRKISNARSYK
jgi:hypothetical protein